MSYEKLFEPITIGNCTIPNRIAMTAMCVGVSEPDGSAGERMAAYYEARAKGGFGLIITEICRVDDITGATAFSQLSLSNDSTIPSIKKATDRVHKYGSKMFIQLHHPGTQSLGLMVTSMIPSLAVGKIFPPYWNMLFKFSEFTGLYGDNPPAYRKYMEKALLPVVGPSAIPCKDGPTGIFNQNTRAITVPEIKMLVKEFANAAERAKKAGADGIELHAAHGYLIGEFISPYTNRRKDKYGGSFENRMRFLHEIYDACREKVGPDYPISVRFNMDDHYETIGYPERGIHLDEGVQIAKELERWGVDLLNASVGVYETMNSIVEPMSFAPGWRESRVRAVKEAVHIPVLAVGVIRTPEQAEEMLERGSQDIIGLGRPSIVDPNWGVKAKEGREDEILRCISCITCITSDYPNESHGAPIDCALNPRACLEYMNPEVMPKDGAGRTVVVVGAGPAGLTAARELALRDFKVVLLEKEKTAGGQLNLANKPPHKDRMDWAIEDLETLAKKAGVQIEYGCDATAETVMNYAPYAVFIATGGAPVVPKIPGADGDNVSTVVPVLKGDLKLENKRVAVIGSGLTGLETAHLLTEQGNHVVMVEMLPKIGPGLNAQFVWDVVPDLEKNCTRFLPDTKLTKIEDGVITVENNKTGRVEQVLVDHVVLSVGVRSVDALAEELASKVKVVKVGDADKTGRISHATQSAYHAARELL